MVRRHAELVNTKRRLSQDAQRFTSVWPREFEQEVAKVAFYAKCAP
jgi:hypothetical protein